MARRPAPRLHRLPQRLDYTLIPAPLDLSLPLVAEKSPLPAIIVTPSSPSEFDFDTPWRHGHSSPDVHTHDYSQGHGTPTTNNYSIAFLAAPRKPTLSERISEMTQRWSSPSVSSYFPPTPDPSTPSKSKFRLARASSSLFGYGKYSFRHGLGPFLLLSLILFVMICHLITHQLASSGPSLDLQFSPVSGVQGSLSINNMHGNAHNMNGFHAMGKLSKMVPGPGQRAMDTDADANTDSNVNSDADGEELETDGHLDDVVEEVVSHPADAEVE